MSQWVKTISWLSVNLFQSEYIEFSLNFWKTVRGMILVWEWNGKICEVGEK